MDHYEFPWYSSIGWVIALFVFAFVIFDLLFVRLYKFNSIQWKRVDYVWVSLALLGILANVEQIRSTYSRNYAISASLRSEANFNRIISASQFGISGAICRKFSHSEYLSLDAIQATQQEFDAQCEWFRSLVPILSKMSSKRDEPIYLSKLLAVYPSGGESFAYQNLSESVDEFNQSIVELPKLKQSSKDSWLQDFIQTFGASLLAIAIALRLTKVTGEIKLERERK